MNSFIALFKKETMEFSKTYKFLIIVTVFLILSILSPLTAKFMPDIMAQFLPKEVAESFPDATALDSWAQFFKNFSQIGLFVVALLFAGTLIHERTEGTLIILLTKGLSRSTVVLAKTIFAMLIWTVMYWFSFAVTYFYTWYYWKNDHVEHLGLAVGNLWLFGLVLISVILLGNVLFKSIYANLLWTAFFVIVWFVVSIFPKAADFNILRLASDSNNLLQGLVETDEYTWIYTIAIGLIVLMLLLSVRVFNKKAIS
ncbi:ABC transporter permease subunit [Rummeliibacillus pycnus]|uniref:ABC transporter permease subunit n=1 Tax=Rummeliibacillus pycnus TaxID=101070 RepID=UPI0037C95E8F